MLKISLAEAQGTQRNFKIKSFSAVISLAVRNLHPVYNRNLRSRGNALVHPLAIAPGASPKWIHRIPLHYFLAVRTFDRC